MSVKIKRVNMAKIAVKRKESVSEGSVSAADNPILPDVSATLSFEGETLPGFGPAEADVVKNHLGEVQTAMGGWPSGDVSFIVPSADMPRVKAWFSGDYHGVTLPESLELKMSMRKGVADMIDSYFLNATARNLFTSPFRLGWSFRYADGSSSPMRGISTVIPNREAPLLPVFSHFIGEKSLSTKVIIRNIPAAVSVSLCASENTKISDFIDKIASVEFFATYQTQLYEQDFAVNGLRNVEIEGKRCRVWHCDSPEASLVEARTEESRAFRSVGSIALQDLAEGETRIKLSVPSKNSPLFSSLPQYGDNPGGTLSETGGRHLELETEPIHLGYPEERKRILRMSLRGVFNRDKIRTELYGAEHRGEWRLLAMGRGPHLSGFCGTVCRWVKVRIEYDTREGDFIDAITFRFAI